MPVVPAKVLISIFFDSSKCLAWKDKLHGHPSYKSDNSDQFPIQSVLIFDTLLGLMQVMEDFESLGAVNPGVRAATVAAKTRLKMEVQALRNFQRADHSPFP